MTTPTPGNEEILRRLDDLTDLFARRLSDDRARRAAVEELGERLRQAELGPFRQYLQPFVAGMVLVIDRLDDYEGTDRSFADSIRDELLELLLRHGVREVAVEGLFDPTVHEVVEAREVDGVPAGTVLAAHRRGFAHDTWVFRPARVTVAA